MKLLDYKKGTFVKTNLFWCFSASQDDKTTIIALCKRDVHVHIALKPWKNEKSTSNSEQLIQQTKALSEVRRQWVSASMHIHHISSDVK